MSEQVKISRREFLKDAALAGAAATAASLGAHTPAMAAGEIPSKWDKEADLVIIGAGGAGLAAAIEGMDNGGSVLVLEKASKSGGTTALSGGIIQGSGTELQKTNNINDTPEAHYKYWIAAGEGIVDPDLIKVLADSSGPNIKWMEAQGIKYSVLTGVSPIPYIDPALMVKRIHGAKADQSLSNLSGGALHAQVLFNSAQKKGAQFLFDSPVTALVNDPKNGVVGVRAQSAGKEITVRAKKAVILTSGGYDRNKDMVRTFSPQQKWASETGVLMGAQTVTGDGIRMALAIGADLAGMGGTISYPAVSVGIAETLPGIWVNKYGQRFCSEGGHYAYIMRAVFFQQEHAAWAIFDDSARKTGAAAVGWSSDLSKEIAAGKIVTAATVAALATALKINGEQLQATLDKWNKDVAGGKDTVFDKTVGLKPIGAAPFYAIMVTDLNLGVQGGVKINTKAQVLDLAGKPIPRLYAAGIVVGGFLGPYYPGSGTALASTVCYGRIAAKTGLGEAAWT